jgi:molybdate transport system substrate-binding protein
VAANFATPAREVTKRFRERTGAKVSVSAGSSGKLFAQIQNGAPFHVFLSADTERPKALDAQRLGVPGSRIRYALGRLALYGPAVEHPESGLRDLEHGRFRHFSIANPKTAPYGAAAKQLLESIDLYDKYRSRIAQGENVTQAFQYVESGAAELGLVALSSIGASARHPYWVVPTKLHDPIEQDAILLQAGKAHPHAAAFMAFLEGDEARRIIEAAGYRTR